MLSIEKFDLVVLDLNLTEKDGLTVLKTLRKDDKDTKAVSYTHLDVYKRQPPARARGGRVPFAKQPVR